MPGRNRSQESESTVDLTRRYLSELGSYPLLTAEQEVELAQAIETGRLAEIELSSTTPTRARKAALTAEIAAADAARRTFIQSNLRLVVSIAKRYQGTGMTLLDLIQEGNLGLMRAVEKFDHRKGFKFSTYATWWIRQSIGRGIADKARTIRLPSHLVDTMAVLSKASATMLKTLGREPTAAELAEETGMTEERVLVALHAAPDLVSLSVSIGDDDAELGDLVADDNAEVPVRDGGPRRSPATTCRTCSTTSTPASGRSSRCASGSRATSPSRSTRWAGASTSPASGSARSRRRRSPSCATRARPGTGASCRPSGS